VTARKLIFPLRLPLSSPKGENPTHFVQMTSPIGDRGVRVRVIIFLEFSCRDYLIVAEKQLTLVLQKKNEVYSGWCTSQIKLELEKAECAGNYSE
jgi:hypothetical protein